MKFGAVAVAALMAAGCAGPMTVPPPGGGAASRSGPARLGPVARKEGRENPTVQVLRDPFQPGTGYVVQPALEQDVATTFSADILIGRIGTKLVANIDGQDRTIGARLTYEHRGGAWIFPREAFDEAARPIPGRRDRGDVRCSGGCNYEEEFYLVLREADLRRSLSAGKPYRFKVLAEKRQDIVELPPAYLQALFARIDAGHGPRAVRRTASVR